MMVFVQSVFVLTALALLPSVSFANPASAELTSAESVRFAREGLRGMVVADDQQAAEWGAEILRKGGNAIDAAVATAFALSVTRPHYAALGGGGFLVFCPAPRDGSASECKVIDFRERAPAAAHRDMYLRNGRADTQLSQNGALASGVPGVTAGLILANEKYGSLKRQMLLREPIRMARKGIRVSTNTARAARERWTSMNEAAQGIFGCGHAEKGACAVGETLRQTDLAQVLESISKKGTDGVYKGTVAQRIVTGLRSAGGIISLKDLAEYRPVERQPVRGQFGGFEVVTMPPPSSGGAVLVQMLDYMTRAAKVGALKDGFASVSSLHAQIHAMSLAFADRAEHMGDSDFYPVPLARLLSQEYLDERWRTYQPAQAALPASSGFKSSESMPEKLQTTHFSVIDAEGNAVSVTETVNGNFGSAFVPAGTGIVMNNQMDDFSIQPGVPNLFGLVGGDANAIAPRKRPLSSMSPTIVRDQKGQVRFVLGAAGGPRIITSVFQTLVNRVQFEMSLADAVSAPRVHHQWRPQFVRVERSSLPVETLESLRRLGYKVEMGGGLAVVHALERQPSGQVIGMPDPRGEGFAAAE